MLYDSGTPSLLSHTKALLSDPTTNPREMFPEADVKPFINRAYLELREIARQVGDNSSLKISYDDPVANQVDYTLPLDWVRLKSVTLELDGKDLSSTLPASSRVVVLEPADYVTAYNTYAVGGLTSPKYVGINDRSLGILAPPDADAVGTNAIQLIYEASTAELSGDTDEPAIARNFHDLICMIAAVDLLATKNQENGILVARMTQKLQRFEAQASEELWDPESRAAISGLDDQPDWTDGSVGFWH